MRFQLNYPPERGIGLEQTSQLAIKDQSLFTKKEYLGEKIISYLLAIILFIIILFFFLRKIIIQN